MEVKLILALFFFEREETISQKFLGVSIFGYALDVWGINLSSVGAGPVQHLRYNLECSHGYPKMMIWKRETPLS